MSCLAACRARQTRLYYLPTKTGIPETDKAEIRKWLDWGRKNVAYLKVRKDLPDWPTPNKVDGSSHLVGDQGFVFLFNPNRKSLDAEFTLDEQSIGLRDRGNFRLSQVYPPSQRSIRAAFGETVRWQVPAQAALILDLHPAR